MSTVNEIIKKRRVLFRVGKGYGIVCALGKQA